MDTTIERARCGSTTLGIAACTARTHQMSRETRCPAFRAACTVSVVQACLVREASLRRARAPTFKPTALDQLM